jgi:hypothetical protein
VGTTTGENTEEFEQEFESAEAATTVEPAPPTEAVEPEEGDENGGPEPGTAPRRPGYTDPLWGGMPGQDAEPMATK